jgi:hypothetical protein
MTTTSPLHSSMPVRIAAPLPRFFSRENVGRAVARAVVDHHDLFVERQRPAAVDYFFNRRLFVIDRNYDREFHLTVMRT